MKPHLIFRLSKELNIPYIPYWMDFIKDKSTIVDQFNNVLDEVFHRYNLDYWITKEYKPANKIQYSPDEVKSGLNRIYRIILKNVDDLPATLIEEVKLTPVVEEAKPAIIGQTEIPHYNYSTSFELFDKPGSLIYVKEAKVFSKGHPQIKIAILDTGIDLSHPELIHCIDKKADFVNIDGMDTTPFIGDITGIDEIPEDEVGHGSHVAGIISGRGIKMPEGIVPQCKILAVRVLATLQQGDKRVGAGLIDNINTGIKWAVDNGADVINMSLGIKHEFGGLPHEEVINYALRKGVTIVAASGNDGTNDKYYPGALPGVLAVGAVDEKDEIAAFSTYGAHVSLVAPGTNIFSSFMNNSYAVCSGTSQAAPYVSGAVALLKSYGLKLGITLKDSQIKYLLKNTSDKIDSQFKTDKGGYGRINLMDAIKLLRYQTNNLN